MFRVKLYARRVTERRPSRREEYSEATRRALVDEGRATFARLGFQSAAVEEISRAARVTRGAFYHHFEDKRALFDAVVLGLQQNAAERIERGARQHKAIWDRLQAGIATYLEVCEDPTYARIVIQEGPIVLGPKRFGEIEEAHPMALLRATLDALARRGEINVPDVGMLTRLLDAMICKLAILLVEHPDRDGPRREGERIIGLFLDSIRARD